MSFYIKAKRRGSKKWSGRLESNPLHTRNSNKEISNTVQILMRLLYLNESHIVSCYHDFIGFHSVIRVKNSFICIQS